jgi:hypothetical protein
MGRPSAFTIVKKKRCSEGQKFKKCKKFRNVKSSEIQQFKKIRSSKKYRNSEGQKEGGGGGSERDEGRKQRMKEGRKKGCTG